MSCQWSKQASINDDMSKRKVADESGSAAPQTPAAGSLPLWARLLISGGITLHLTAVFVAPFRFATGAFGGSSPLAEAIQRPLAPYIDAMYLDHGYFFFAPNPGPNHLVDCRLEFADGRPAEELRFPNLATKRPRLLYHRHFMLSEALNASFAPPEFAPEPSPPPLTASAEERERFQLDVASHRQAKTDWQRRRRQYEAMRGSIENHLKHETGAERVTLTRIQHRQPLPDEFEVLGRKLNDPESYVKLPETMSGARP
jgi:hypothetical protein